MIEISCQNEEETATVARQLAEAIQSDWHPYTIHLHGELGAGKTTFSRYFIQSFGIKGAVKSPTYTLIEPYKIILNEQENEAKEILHMDLYRLGSPLELYDLGFLEEDDALWLIEWPEKGLGVLPVADLEMRLNRDHKELVLTLSAGSELGEHLIEQLREISAQSEVE